MKFEILLSTQCNEIQLIERLNIKDNVLVINQCGSESVDSLVNQYPGVRWKNSSTKGLSVSRNLALTFSDADVCLFADDDILYVDGLSDVILNAFRKNPTADIIAFYVDGFADARKPNWTVPRRLNFLTAMKVSSVQIAFRRNVVLRSELYFKEEFGAGARYYSGEENIWLWDCIRKGLEIHYVPVKIATLVESESTWFEGYTDWYFVSKGAAFAAMSELLAPLLILQFAIRKHRLWKTSISFRSSMRAMFRGRSIYLSDLESR